MSIDLCYKSALFPQRLFNYPNQDTLLSLQHGGISGRGFSNPLNKGRVTNSAILSIAPNLIEFSPESGIWYPQFLGSEGLIAIAILYRLQHFLNFKIIEAEIHIMSM